MQTNLEQNQIENELHVSYRCPSLPPKICIERWKYRLTNSLGQSLEEMILFLEWFVAAISSLATIQTDAIPHDMNDTQPFTARRNQEKRKRTII